MFNPGDKVRIKPGHPYVFFDRRAKEEIGTFIEYHTGCVRGTTLVKCPNQQVLGFRESEIELFDPTKEDES